MTDFTHLRPTITTVRYTPPGLGWPEGAAFLLAHAGTTNSAFTKALREHRARHAGRNDDEGGAIDYVEFLCDAAPDVLAGAILRGWIGIVDKDGVEVPYSVEAARDLLKHLSEIRRIPDEDAVDVLRGLVVFAVNGANFAPVLHVEVLTKN